MRARLDGLKRKLERDIDCALDPAQACRVPRGRWPAIWSKAKRFLGITAAAEGARCAKLCLLRCATLCYATSRCAAPCASVPGAASGKVALSEVRGQGLGGLGHSPLAEYSSCKCTVITVFTVPAPLFHRITLFPQFS